jgi:hypothetical protein
MNLSFVTKIKLFTLFFVLLFFATTKSTAQEVGEEKTRVQGYVTPSYTYYPRVVTTGNGQLARGGGTNQQPFTATDNTDISVLSLGVNQQSEPHIKIDNNNPLNLIVSANDVVPNPNAGVGTTSDNQGYYYSYDGGANWAGSDYYPNIALPTTLSHVVNGDPSTAFDKDGDAFISTLEATHSITTPDYQGFYNAASTFPPSTTSWINPPAYTSGVSSTSNEFDKEMITIDNYVNSPYLNNIYCVGTEFTANSCVGGITGNIKFFGGNVTGNMGGALTVVNTDLRNGASGFGFGANVQTGPNGEVYACWADYPSGTIPDAAGNIGFAYSANGGTTWQNQTLAVFGSNYAGGINPSCANDFQSDLSGSAFGSAIDAHSPEVNGLIRMNDFPSMAVDRSCCSSAQTANTHHPGRIYIAFPQIGGQTSIIALSYSDDHGLTWSTPAEISITSSSPYFHAVNPSNASLQNPVLNYPISFFPAVAVDDATGIVSVAYEAFDGDLLPNTTVRQYNTTNTYVAYSIDGGVTFDNIRVSDVAHTTKPIPGFNTYAGDYLSITAYGGKAYIAWADNRIQLQSELWQVYVSELDYSNYLYTCTVDNPNTLYVNEPNIIPAGTTKTYKAIDEVIIPQVGSSFQNASGSQINIYACHEVNLRDGFSGSKEVHAYLTCTELLSCRNSYNGVARLSGSTHTGVSSATIADTKPVILQTKLGENIKLGIFPNPTSSLVYLDLSAQNAGSLLVSLRDINGKQVMYNSFSAKEGANSFKVDLSNLSQGVYFINITDENGTTIKNDRIVLMPQ